jgi:hypothetical protein
LILLNDRTIIVWKGGHAKINIISERIGMEMNRKITSNNAAGWLWKAACGIFDSRVLRGAGLAVLCMVYVLCLSDRDIAKAAQKELEILPADVSTASDGCVLAGIEGTYAAQIQDALDRVNEIRREACQEGVPRPSNPDSRLTADDYVPIQWSSGLEYIARIRAAEAAVLSGHERPNGTRCFSLQAPGGLSSEAEVLAWNSASSASMVTGINQWYSEKEDWVNQNPDAVTGHYTSMIDPGNRYIGLGAFVSVFGAWRCSISGEFSSIDDTGFSETGMTGKCIQTIEIEEDRLKELQIFQGDENVSDGLGLGIGKKAALTARVKVVIDDDTSFCNYLDSITWTSSNPSVAQVDSKGTVTVKKAGNAVITASAGNGMSASCKLINAPEGTSLSSLKGGNGSITLRWKRQKQADGYIIRISKDKSLDGYGMEWYVEGNKNTTQVFGNLERRQAYYICIQTYKETGGKVLYSDWSKVKKVRTK